MRKKKKKEKNVSILSLSKRKKRKQKFFFFQVVIHLNRSKKILIVKSGIGDLEGSQWEGKNGYWNLTRKG